MNDADLLRRAFEIVKSAYATHEWLLHSRTERTDETLEMLMDYFSEVG